MLSLTQEENLRCRRCYGAYRKTTKAPVMIALKDMSDNFYIEAKDGSFSTNIHGEHCSWCARVKAIQEWKEKQDEGCNKSGN